MPQTIEKLWARTSKYFSNGYACFHSVASSKVLDRLSENAHLTSVCKIGGNLVIVRPQCETSFIMYPSFSGRIKSFCMFGGKVSRTNLLDTPSAGKSERAFKTFSANPSLSSRKVSSTSRTLSKTTRPWKSPYIKRFAASSSVSSRNEIYFAMCSMQIGFPSQKCSICFKRSSLIFIAVL